MNERRLQKNRERLERRLALWQERLDADPTGKVALAQKEYVLARLARLDENYDSPGKEQGEGA